MRDYNYSCSEMPVATGFYETLDSIKHWEFHDGSSDCELLNGVEAWIYWWCEQSCYERHDPETNLMIHVKGRMHRSSLVLPVNDLVIILSKALLRYKGNDNWFHFQRTYTGCFTTLGHNCTRWFPRSLWSKISYKHVSDFGRLRSYDRLKLRIEGNDYWQ